MSLLIKLLHPPSERSETGGYTVFTLCVRHPVRPSVRTQKLWAKARFEPGTFRVWALG